MTTTHALPWTFERFEPGHSFGVVHWTPDRAAFTQWNALFGTCPDTQSALPAGMISMVALRAYMALLADRPPGNIHAMQATRVHRLPPIGTALATELVCLSRELRNARRWVAFETRTRTEDGTPCFDGTMTMLWAA